MSDLLPYVLVTPARNEDRYIKGTIQSVISQSIRPRRWIIVSDGSTDATDEIVRTYLADNPWLELVRRPERSTRDFAGKVHTFNVGLERLNGCEYEVIGNLDADITFAPDYFEFLLSRFMDDPRLGVAGTPFIEGTMSYDYRFSSLEHVSGACQLFRRRCFEEIGGYTPIAGGGIDWIAVTTARMKGWRTQTFIEKAYFHHRPMGTAVASPLKAWFNQGKQDGYLGGHPLWQIFRSVFQMTRKPYVLGGLYLLSGYCWSRIFGVKAPLPLELIAFHRTEQLKRLRDAVSNRIRPAVPSPKS